MKGPVMQTVERILAPVAIAVSMIALALAWRALLCQGLLRRPRGSRVAVSRRFDAHGDPRHVKDD